MATNKYQELLNLTDADLVSELSATEKQYQKMHFDNALKGLENPITLREVRRDIARIKTEMRRREIAAMSDAELAGRTHLTNRRRKSK